MPIDVNLLRAYKGFDPEVVRKSENKRRAPPANVDEAIRLDAEWVAANKTVELINKERNRIDDEVKASANKKPTDEQRAKSKELAGKKKGLDEQLDLLAEQRDAAILKIGNVLHESVPDAAREEDLEVCVTSYGDFKVVPDVISHHQALWMIGGYEPERGAAIAGHRGYYLTGPGVLLNQALISYAIGFLTARKHTPVMPPYFMTKHAMAKVSQLSDFDESLYHVGAVHRGGDEKDDDDKYLIATSEQPLCCLNMDTNVKPTELPIKYCGFSTCFRKEAGKFGVDTLGIFRVHQFDKVEQFVIVAPDETVSYAMLEEMRANSEDFLKSLELPFKTINVVSGELNLAAAKKYDINAWFPSLQKHKELVSASNCTDFQSRATNTYVTVTQPDGTTKRCFAHMLNATLCALTRTICCILENHQGVKTVDGKEARGVHVPKVLLPYMAGVDFLPFVREPRADAQPSKETKANARKQSVPAKKEPARRASFKVAGNEFPTAVAALASKEFRSVEEYVAFVNQPPVRKDEPA